MVRPESRALRLQTAAVRATAAVAVAVALRPPLSSLIFLLLSVVAAVAVAVDELPLVEVEACRSVCVVNLFFKNEHSNTEREREREKRKTSIIKAYVNTLTSERNNNKISLGLRGHLDRNMNFLRRSESWFKLAIVVFNSIVLLESHSCQAVVHFHR